MNSLTHNIIVMDTILSNISDPLSTLSEPSTSVCISLDTVSSVSIMTKPIHDTFLGIPNEWASFLVPTVASILVFLVGIVIENLHKKKQVKKETKEFKDTFFEWVNLNKIPIHQQVEKISKLVDDISTNESLQNVRFESPTLVVNKLSIASAENLVHHFIYNSKKPYDDTLSDNIFKIVTSLDYLSKVDKYVIEEYQSYENLSLSYMREWNMCFPELVQQISMQVRYNTDSPFSSKIRDSFIQWYNAHSNDTSVNMVQAYYLVIEPVVNYTRGLEETSLQYADLGQIPSLVNKSNLVFVQWDVMNDGFKKQFSFYAGQIKSTYEALVISVNYLKNHSK